MKKQILLTLGIVLLVNGIILSGIYYFNSNFNIISNSFTGTGSLMTENKVIKQNKTTTYNISNVQSKIMGTIKEVGDSMVSIVISKDLNVYYYADPFSLRPQVEKKTEKVGGGSGIIISSNGYILTNKHVVQDLEADYSVVTKKGDIYKVDKIRTDPILDIAVIHIMNEDGTKVYDLQTSDIIDFESQVNVGQFVLAIGNALSEYNNTTTLGILSAKGRQLEENNGSLYIGLYQTDAAINPGNSGGPLININGEVIGVNTAITAMGQGIGFSIPINKQFVNATLESIKQYGKIKRPLLGVQIIQLNKAIAKKFELSTYEGVLIQDVLENSPAAKGGLKKGDIILEVDDIKINQNKPIIYTLFTKKLQDDVNITINRDGEVLTKEIKLKEF